MLPYEYTTNWLANSYSPLEFELNHFKEYKSQAILTSTGNFEETKTIQKMSKVLCKDCLYYTNSIYHNTCKKSVYSSTNHISGIKSYVGIFPSDANKNNDCKYFETYSSSYKMIVIEVLVFLLFLGLTIYSFIEQKSVMAFVSGIITAAMLVCAMVNLLEENRTERFVFYRKLFRLKKKEKSTMIELKEEIPVESISDVIYKKTDQLFLLLQKNERILTVEERKSTASIIVSLSTIIKKNPNNILKCSLSDLEIYLDTFKRSTELFIELKQDKTITPKQTQEYKESTAAFQNYLYDKIKQIEDGKAIEFSMETVSLQKALE